MQFISVTAADVNKLLRNINPKKATGVDNTPQKLVKLAANVLLQPLSEAVNKSFSTELFPDKANIALVSPVYKGND